MDGQMDGQTDGQCDFKMPSEVSSGALKADNKIFIWKI